MTPIGVVYGFTIERDPASTAELLAAAEARAVYEQLRAAFHLEPLAYLPSSAAEREHAATWIVPGFPIVPGSDPVPFLRGDTNADGRTDVTDALVLAQALFRQGPALACAQAGDTDDDGRVALTDAIHLLLYLFGGDATLPEPAMRCGIDPTLDALECRAHGACG